MIVRKKLSLMTTFSSKEETNTLRHVGWKETGQKLEESSIIKKRIS